MGLFGPTEKEKKDQTVAELTEEVKTLSTEVAKLVGTRDAVADELGLSETIQTLMKEKTELEITIDKVKEEHARETREIEHKLGLHKKQVEAEREQAVQEAKLAVREENLNHEKETLQEQMEFQRKSMEREMDASRNLMNQILTRLPDVQWNIKETRGVPEIEPSDEVEAEVVDEPKPRSRKRK